MIRRLAAVWNAYVENAAFVSATELIASEDGQLVKTWIVATGSSGYAKSPPIVAFANRRR